jgi:hypothetical protein
VEKEGKSDQLGREYLAKQLVTYADAITAFSFVQSVAFGFALGQKDFRTSVLKGLWIVALVLGVAYAIYGVFVGRCRNGETGLLGLSDDAKILQWRQGIWRGRFLVLCLGFVLSGIALTLVWYGDYLQKKNPSKTEKCQAQLSSPRHFAVGLLSPSLSGRGLRDTKCKLLQKHVARAADNSSPPLMPEPRPTSLKLS